MLTTSKRTATAPRRKSPSNTERGPIITEFIANYDGMTLVPEIVKVKGDDALPAGTQDFIDKSTQSMFAGADVRR